LGKRGKLFVISAPSGSGKTTLCHKLIRSFSGKRRLVRSVSVTTRPPRKGEKAGRDYFFISLQEFRRRKKARRLLEWAKVLGNFYGTPRGFVEKHINRGDDVLLSIDVKGARKIKAQAYATVLIFILPPFFQELARRLRHRSTESKAEIERRLKLAKEEMAFVQEYDYVVLNDKISRALSRLKEIIREEREK
jgi:guanylate kinase